VSSTSNDFLYSLITMMIVGTVLTFSFTSYVNPLKEISEVNKLKEILNQVTAKAEEALAIVTECNTASHFVIPLPLTIGDRDYWIRFANDSSGTWLEAAFGRLDGIEGQKYRVYLPRAVYASGIFEGKNGLALLNCSLNGSTPRLILSRKE